jgi:hypothetical protein
VFGKPTQEALTSFFDSIDFEDLVRESDETCFLEDEKELDSQDLAYGERFYQSFVFLTES